MRARATVGAFVGAMMLAVTADAAPAHPPVEMRVNGQFRCVCTPMFDGCYTAKHCFQGLPAGARITIAGQRVYSWTLDPARDLAHVPVAADPGQAMGEAQPGASGEWYAYRSGTAYFRRQHPECNAPAYYGAIDQWCVTSSPDVNYGDSGGGMYVDGRLVGIISLFDPVGCGVWTIPVP